MNTYHGYLTGITELPSGDAFLKFFTREEGLVSIMCRKFGVSKKRKQHLDFFRLLELEVTAKNVLRTADVKFIHESFVDYSSMEMGYRWLDKISKTMPEGKVSENLFEVLNHVLADLNNENRFICDVYFVLHLLEESGHVQRFDAVRTGSYFIPSTFSFSESESPGSLFLPNKVRQFLEFVRRSSLEEILDKKEVFEEDLLICAQNILKALEESHL